VPRKIFIIFQEQLRAMSKNQRMHASRLYVRGDDVEFGVHEGTRIVKWIMKGVNILDINWYSTRPLVSPYSSSWQSKRS